MLQQIMRMTGGYQYDNSDEEFSDDSSSEEENEPFNPLEVIDAIRASESQEEKQKLKKILLEKFLDQKRPIIAAKMKDFLLEDGVLESLLSFIHRVGEKKEGQTEETQLSAVPDLESKPTNSPSLIRKLVTDDTEQNVKRSFRLTKLFTNPTREFEVIMNQKIHTILDQLFRIFEPQSNGNFHHFKAIFEYLLSTRVSDTTRRIVDKELFKPMLDYLYEPAVADAAVAFFCVQWRSPTESAKFYGSLSEAGSIDLIGDKIYSIGQRNTTFAADFFIRVVDRLCNVEAAGALFSDLARTPKFINSLFNVVTSLDERYTTDQKKACASVLRELLLRGSAPPAVVHEFSRPLPNMLASVNEKLHEYATKYIEALCNELITLDGLVKKGPDHPIEFSSYTVDRPFGMNRLVLTEILSDLIVNAPECIDNVPPQSWRVLSSWFFDYSHNNVYHCQFYKIIQAVFIHNHEESIKTLLTKYKFLTNLIRGFSDPKKSTLRGFIIQISNVIRLAGDMLPPQAYLKGYLAAHDQWKIFQPTLRKETQSQRRQVYEAVRRFHRVDDDQGIDLGSSYAKSLGFTATEPPVFEAPVIVTPTVAPSSTSTTTATATTTTTTTTSSKKKKKKKKKSSSSGSSSESSEEVEQQQQKSQQKDDKQHNEQEEEEEENEDELLKKDSGSEAWWNDLKKDLEENGLVTEAPSEEPNDKSGV